MEDWMNWTSDEVAEWLTSINLPHLITSIYSLKITGDHLPKIDDNFLKNYLKVTSPAERILFLQNLNMLPNMFAPPTISSAPSTPTADALPVKKRPPPKPNSIMDAHILINSPENLHSGWIIKQGGRIRTWKRRYMVLHQGCLYYFENEKSAKQKGSLALPGYVLSESNEVKEFPNCMKLAHKNPNKRIYLICTSSQREKDKWMECIQTELDLYKEENLIGEAIYGDGNEKAELNEILACPLNERLSDGDNDEEVPNDFDTSPIPNLPSRMSRDKFPEHPSRLVPAKSMISRVEHPSTFSPEHLPHASTVRARDNLNPPISTSNSAPPSSSYPSVPPPGAPHHSISPHSPISSCPSSPTSHQLPPSLPPPPEPDQSEDHYLIISSTPSTPVQTDGLPNGLANRQLPGIPDGKLLPPSRPLPTLPSEFPEKHIPPQPTLETTMVKRHSTPGVFHTGAPQNSISEPGPSLPPVPRHSQLIKRKSEAQSYEDVDMMDDIEALGANFGKTLQSMSDEADDAVGVYISPNMEVLPGACIQSKFTRIRAEEVLASINHDGMYLIRDSSEESISMVLTVWCKDRCKHYKVFKHEKGYCLHRGTYFTSLEELIRQYRVTPLPRSNFTLKTPYNVHSSNSRFS